MVLTTNFFKIAKSVLKRNQRPLIETVHDLIMEKILRRIFILNVFFICVLGVLVAAAFFYMLIGLLATIRII